MKNKESDIIDLGKWDFPSSWEELDLKMFQQIDEYYSDKDKDFNIVDVLHILTGHPIEEINALPIEFSEKIMEGLSWLAEEPKYDAPRSYIMIDGVKYEVNVREKLRTGEYIAINTLLKSDSHNYAAILAILCRKEGEAYDSKFENEILPSRIELFEKQPMMQVMPIVNFFLECYIILGTITQLSLRVEEAISLTQQHIEISHKNGELSKHCMKSLMKRLQKLKESIKSI